LPSCSDDITVDAGKRRGRPRPWIGFERRCKVIKRYEGRPVPLIEHALTATVVERLMTACGGAP
jgi:hypothetical protein